MVDADEAIRRSAHHLLGCQGATVETARDAHEAIALARQTPYSAALVDIRLPDLDGYETYRRLREVQPGVPIILMTGFGYDPSHSIVKARQEGLQTVLYKPFRADRLMEAVEQALRRSAPGADGVPSRDTPAVPGHPLPDPPKFRSRSSRMHIDWWIVALAAIGHGCLLVWLINVSHALGVHERWMGRTMAAIALAWLAATVMLVRATIGLSWQAWPAPVQSYGLLCVAIAIVSLLLSFWRLHLRRVPAGVSGRATHTLIAEPGEADSLIGTGKHAWMLRLPGNDFRNCFIASGGLSCPSCQPRARV